MYITLHWHVTLIFNGKIPIEIVLDLYSRFFPYKTYFIHSFINKSLHSDLCSLTAGFLFIVIACGKKKKYLVICTIIIISSTKFHKAS